MFGMSFVFVIFEDDVDIYLARTRVLKRINYAQGLLPAAVVSTLGPNGIGLGHIFWYTLDAASLDWGELRALQDWYIKFALQTVPGVSEVASFGGFQKQYQIVIDPHKLSYYNITLKDLIEKVRVNNNDVGGRKFEMADMGYIIGFYYGHYDGCEGIYLRTGTVYWNRLACLFRYIWYLGSFNALVYYSCLGGNFGLLVAVKNCKEINVITYK